MKNFYSCMLLISITTMIFQPVCAAETITEQLEGALKEGDALKVKKFLRKLDRMQMPSQEKKSLFLHLIGMNDDLLASEKSTNGLFSNRLDMIRFVGGSLATIYGLSGVVSNWYALSKETCQYCKAINCRDRCRCTRCDHHCYGCGCPSAFQKIRLDEDSTGRFMYALQGAPYIGFLAGGLYQMYQGLRGAGRESAIVSAQDIKVRLKELAGA